jgi:hypothetical protein
LMPGYFSVRRQHFRPPPPFQYQASPVVIHHQSQTSLCSLRGTSRKLVEASRPKTILV